MTPLRCLALGLALLAPFSAFSGWEYTEPKPTVKRRSAGSDLPPPAPRVQVFGRGGESRSAPEVDVNDYAEMLREDRAAVPAAVTETVAEPDSSETEFETLRNRIRTRQVAEAEAPPAPAPRAAKKPKRAADLPPPPPMETEVITPQAAPGKKVKAGGVHSANESAAARGNEPNAAFGYTHILPSPYTIPQGSWVFGTSFAHGVFDFLQLSTSVVRLVQQQWNVQAKVPLVDFPTFVASAFVDYETFNPHRIDAGNPDRWSKRWQPGIVTGYEINPDMAFFLGGNFNFGTDPGPVTTTSGYLHGAQINTEWSWLYNPESSRLGSNALSVGLKYDLTYSMFGFGVTHHWRTFDIGVHYTFADRSKFVPIFGFTTGATF